MGKLSVTDTASPISIRQSTPKDVPALQKLWQETFGDPPAFTNRFYETFGKDCAWVAESDGKIISMLHALPVALTQNGQSYWGVYLYALATSPDFRGRGIASQLLSIAERAPFSTPPVLEGAVKIGLTQVSDATPAFSLLIPGEDSLFAYYRAKGYTLSASIISPEAPDYPSHLRQGLGDTPIFLKPLPFYTLSCKIPEGTPPPIQTALWKVLSPQISSDLTPILSHFMQ